MGCTVEIAVNRIENKLPAPPLRGPVSGSKAGWLARLTNHFPPGQFLRYALVGGWNTVFGYSTYIVFLSLLNHLLPLRLLTLTAVLAAIISTPLNITVAYLGYKFFVFRTKGKYLVEWVRCFAVYGTSMVPSLLVLAALTRFLQTQLDHHHAYLAAALLHLELFLRLSGGPLRLFHTLVAGKTVAGKLAGAFLTGFTMLYSFVGHRKITFRLSTEQKIVKEDALASAASEGRAGP
jgi:putative flippase GtrA